MEHRISRRRLVQAVGAIGLASGAGSLDLVQAAEALANTAVKTRAVEVETEVAGRVITELPLVASHVALFWKGEHDAALSVSFSPDGVSFGPALTVTHDEVGESKRDGWTYGAVLPANGARFVAVNADRHLKHVKVLALADGAPAASSARKPSGGGSGSGSGSGGQVVSTTVTQPAVVTRAGWGCDESLMTWAPEFYPVQKLICHHTATQNNDPDPAATVRAIYYYHAVTQGWGDIGYNFLIDESGTIYEGRYSRSYAAAESPTGEDLSGNGVTGAHAYQYNSGTVGIALIGNLVSQDATAAAKQSLERLLAWKAQRHQLDPNGNAVYTNPVTLVKTTFPNIAGHRDVNATECPGGDFYQTLPNVRAAVAALIAGSTPPAIAGISPASGPTTGGTVVTINGSGFSGATAVSFGDAAAAFVIGSDSSITATSPSHAAGSVDVRVTSPAGTSPIVSADQFTFVTSGGTPTFTLSVTPSSQSVRRNRQTQFSVGVTPLNGFSSPVLLSVSGLPRGARASFSPSSLTSGTATLTVTAGKSTGTYTLTITATGGSVTQQQKVTLTVTR